MVYILKFLGRTFPTDGKGLISINAIPKHEVNSLHEADIFCLNTDISTKCQLVLTKVIKNKMRCMQKKRRKRVYCRVNTVNRTGVFKLVKSTID